jgi:hypothetical protein
MTGPHGIPLRSERPTGQPSVDGVPICYRTDATDDGAACALCYQFGTQQALVHHFPTCIGCVAGQRAAKLAYARGGMPS